MNFAADLLKLLNEEENQPVDPLAELLRVSVSQLESINNNKADLSLQVEEVYDIIKDFDSNEKEVKAAERREKLLLQGLIEMFDLVSGVISYMQGRNTEHILVIETKLNEIMNGCGIEPLGFNGERLDPNIHTVSSAVFDNAPIESVVRVLERGYMYRGKILRKATVILSKGASTE